MRRFWRRVAARGAPWIEPIPGDPDHRLVTFLWRSRTDCAVSVIGSFLASAPEQGRLCRLASTDVWFRSVRLPADVRSVYHLYRAPTRTIGRPTKAFDFSRLQADPRNRTGTFFYPKDPDQPKDREIFGSILRLPRAAAGPARARPPPSARGRVELHRFRSRGLRNERRVWLYRPSSRSRARPRPPHLVVVFDGLAYLTMVPTPEILDDLQWRGRTGPVYAVLVDNFMGGARVRELINNPALVRFLTEELLPWTEREVGLRFPAGRVVLAGSSAGGVAAAFAARKAPHRFGKVLSQSGAFVFPIPGRRPRALFRAYSDSPRLPIRFYLDAGRLETIRYAPRATPLLEANRQFRDLLRAKGYPLRYRELPSGHDYLSWRDSLGPALEWLLRG